MVDKEKQRPLSSNEEFDFEVIYKPKESDLATPLSRKAGVEAKKVLEWEKMVHAYRRRKQ